MKKDKRNLYVQRMVGRDDNSQLPNDDDGHLIATIFGGEGNIDNLISIDKTVNRSGGACYKLEQEGKEAIEDNKFVSVEIYLIYEDNTIRPRSIKVVYFTDGVRKVKEVKNIDSNKNNNKNNKKII